MRALVIYPDAPSLPENRTGGAARLQMFLEALNIMGVTSIDMLHFAPADFLANLPAPGDLARQQSEFWGHRVDHVHTVPLARRNRQTNYSHFVAPLLSIRNHEFFRGYCGSEQVEQVKACLAIGYDLILVQRLAGICALLQVPELKTPVIFDLCDLEHRGRRRSALNSPGVKAQLYAAQSVALKAATLKGARLSKLTLLASKDEATEMKRMGGRSLDKLDWVSNSVPIPASASPLPSLKTALFLGSFSHQPNVPAAERLVKKIWPLVRQELPDARLMIAGRPSENLSFSEAPPEGVEVLGFVPDLASLYDSTRVVCCTVMDGNGTRVKLIEAAAHGKAIVSTSVGAEGLSFQSGRNILIKDEDHDFAQSIILLMKDDVACHSLGENARALAENSYDAKALARRTAALIGNALSS